MRESVVKTLQRLGQHETDWRRLLATYGLSLAVHFVALLICSLIVFEHPAWDEVFTSIVTFDEGDPTELVVSAPIQPDQLIDRSTDAPVLEPTAAMFADANSPVSLKINDLDPALKLEELAAPALANLDLSSETSGRSAGARAALVKKFGGNSASEAAVASGLRWLARHQLSDGGWNFSHAAHPDCNGACTQSGDMVECRIAATGLALLSYLGGGHTHQSGSFQLQVKRGLEFLLKSGKLSSNGLDLRGELGSDHTHAAFYSQGIATIALCELLALTKDGQLASPAQNAINFILSYQDPIGGGWRYEPQQAGDTSVVGWQIMALKSGQNSGLTVPFQSFRGAERFLNRVQSEQGSRYGYTGSSNPTPATTAVGLLCRMYLGWGKRDGGLRKGVVYLDRTKPSHNNMYYNYYATQVLHHYGGEEWTRWNDVMRDQLVNTQLSEQSGHLAGSWDVADPHGSSGGRLYMTCLAVMTLEVYYRHLPIYQRDKLKVEY
ncbi:MAG: hypothetical protein B7Z55_03105 [Planctomycetales bacterium 12-60-4]|nr:MAG: hypothetical protein B7Z55_03105 [Planctomycetales bacterium 12-60-4]